MQFEAAWQQGHPFGDRLCWERSTHIQSARCAHSRLCSRARHPGQDRTAQPLCCCAVASCGGIALSVHLMFPGLDAPPHDYQHFALRCMGSSVAVSDSTCNGQYMYMYMHNVPIFLLILLACFADYAVRRHRDDPIHEARSVVMKALPYQQQQQMILHQTY